MPKQKHYERGEHIGPYEVIRKLASGGMSTLYEATPLPELRSDLLTQGVRRVAVKVVRHDALPDNPHDVKVLRERFNREFQTLYGLARFGHPNIVHVYDYAWMDGVPYYAMEHVEGLTLGEALEDRPHLGPALYVLGELCGAVSFLHHAGICHRDLKPSNVMLRREGGSPVLIDFGICLPPTGRTLTGPHELLGTTAYLSPEYAAHLLDPDRTRAYVATPTDDVWALGIIFYELLTGAVPWRTPSSLPERLLAEIHRAQPPHPCEVNKQVPRALGELVMRMLEPNRRKRIPNATEVLPLLGAAAERSRVLGRVPAPRKRHVHKAGKGSKPSGNTRGHLSGGMMAVMSAAIIVFGVSAVAGGTIGLKMGYEQARTQPSSGVRASTNPGATEPTPMIREPRPSESDAQTWEPDPFHYWLAKGRALPRRPFPGQLLAPCDPSLDEMIGACWKYVHPVHRDGTDAECTSAYFEVRGKCYLAAFPDSEPSTLKQLDAGMK